MGGYGFFGSRICELMAKDPGCEVLVAGRSLKKAKAYGRARPDLRIIPVRVDRDVGLCAALAELRPWLVIDAAGPFQEASYDVAEACIAAGCHYIDIADGRRFVEDFHALDASARKAGVTVISGASSVPALSSAVVEHLAEGLDSVGLMESAITASNRATAGRSVFEAILSYVGKPIELRQGGRTIKGRGWRSLRRRTFVSAGAAPLRGRWVALCDVPDLGLLSDRLPGRPLVVFRAGAELAIQNLALWLLSWPVQWGWIGDLRRYAVPLGRLRGLTSRLGSDRSAMQVTVVGQSGADLVERRWTLIADQGRGPYAPCLAAPLLARRLAAGELRTGAFAAAGSLPLETFQPDFTALEYKTEVVETRRARPLYAQVMDRAFEDLPAAVREMHELGGAGVAEGRSEVIRGCNPLARAVAWVMGFPKAAADVPVTVRFFEQQGKETWIRSFADKSFSSRLSQHGKLLIERFGPMRFGFELTGTEQGLSMHLRRWWIGPMPLPLALGPRGVATETDDGGRFHFDVPISLPLIGLIVRYHGWLRRL